MRNVIAALAALIATAATVPAFAAPLADQEACNSLAYSLAEKASGKKLPQVEAVKVDELIIKLEGQCNANQLADAEATAKEIEAALK